MPEHYDTIIVGAGSSGGVLAARLTEQADRSVLLLDAGPDFATLADTPSEIITGRAAGIGVITDSPSTPDDYIWRFPARPNAYQAERRYARGRLVGGSSAVNGQVFIRALPEDFERWVSFGNDEWTYEAALPYYRKLETHLNYDDEYHGQDGPIHVRQYPRDKWCPPAEAFYTAARNRGFAHCQDDNRPGTTGVGPATHNNADDRRQSVLLTYIAQARSRPNLTIRARTVVERLVLRGNRVTGVTTRGPGGTDELAADEVILCAGALATPQLLMLAGIGPAEDLARVGVPVLVDRPGVGANLCEHPYIHLLWNAHEGMARPTTDPGHPVVLRHTTSTSEHVNDAKIYMHNSVPSAALRAADFAGVVGSLCNLDFVASRGRVRLVNDDINTEPDIEFNLLLDPGDRARLRESYELMLDLVRSSELAQVVKAPRTPLPASADVTDWINRNVHAAMHPSATCAMGPADRDGAVVDQRGRVHGVDGLRVADASILPEVPRANLNATVMMMAERIADSIVDSA
jgi:choline dehydrogenase